MKKSLLCVVLLAAVPALATISKVQSAATWNATGSACNVSLTGTTAGKLIVLWITWSPSSLTLNLSYRDPNNNTYASAVGPTIQSASGTAAQIVYAKNINPGTDNIAFPFNSGSATSVSCVAVEYSGADTMYPLDSVSEAISNTGAPSGALDSGTASPANANLLLFGGGNSDNGSATTGLPWTTIQSNGGNITEQQILPANNTLQRATAIISPSPTTGNWLMQMAVFRGASWTVAQGSSATRAHGVLDASQFPGADIGAQVNSANAACTTRGCLIHIPAGYYSYSTPIVLGGGIYPVTLQCDPGGNQGGATAAAATLIFTGSGTAVTYNVGANGAGINGCTILSSTGSASLGLYIQAATKSVFSNLQVGECKSRSRIE